MVSCYKDEYYVTELHDYCNMQTNVQCFNCIKVEINDNINKTLSFKLIQRSENSDV